MPRRSDIRPWLTTRAIRDGCVYSNDGDSKGGSCVSDKAHQCDDQKAGRDLFSMALCRPIMPTACDVRAA